MEKRVFAGVSKDLEIKIILGQGSPESKDKTSEKKGKRRRETRRKKTQADWREASMSRGWPRMANSHRK